MRILQPYDIQSACHVAAVEEYYRLIMESSAYFNQGLSRLGITPIESNAGLLLSACINIDLAINIGRN